MNKSSVIHARVEPATKQMAEEVLRKLGLSPTAAIRIFYKQICLRRGLPFNILIPNAVTLRTLEKSRKGRDIQKYDSLEDLFESWEK